MTTMIENKRRRTGVAETRNGMATNGGARKKGSDKSEVISYWDVRSPRLSESRAFHLIGQLIRIKVGYGKGLLARVIDAPDSGGRVTVQWHYSDCFACYTLKEIELYHPGEDEEGILIQRVSALHREFMATDSLSDALMIKISRRMNKLRDQIRAIQRANGHWRRQALTLYTGGVL